MNRQFPPWETCFLLLICQTNPSPFWYPMCKHRRSLQSTPTSTDINMDYLTDLHIHLEYNNVFIYYHTHSHLWHFKHFQAKLLKPSAQKENYYKSVIKRSTKLPLQCFIKKYTIIKKISCNIKVLTTIYWTQGFKQNNQECWWILPSINQMRESFLCVTVPPKALCKPKPCWKAIHDWSYNPVFLHTFTGFCEKRPILNVIIIQNGNCYN